MVILLPGSFHHIRNSIRGFYFGNLFFPGHFPENQFFLLLFELYELAAFVGPELRKVDVTVSVVERRNDPLTRFRIELRLGKDLFDMLLRQEHCAYS